MRIRLDVTEAGFWDWLLVATAGACTLVMLVLRYGVSLIVGPDKPVDIPQLPPVTQLMIYSPYFVPIVAGSAGLVALITLIWYPRRRSLRFTLLGVALLGAVLGLAATIWAIVAPPLQP